MTSITLDIIQLGGTIEKWKTNKLFIYSLTDFSVFISPKEFNGFTLLSKVKANFSNEIINFNFPDNIFEIIFNIPLDFNAKKDLDLLLCSIGDDEVIVIKTKSLNIK